MMLPTTSSPEFARGPQEIGPRFRFCAAQALIVIHAWLEALDNFRHLLGRDPLAERGPWEQQMEAWYQAVPTPEV